MTPSREYLVALDVRTTLHAWLAATSDDEAIKNAEALYGEDDSAFTAKGGSIESIAVLESRPLPADPDAPRPKRFRVAFEQPVVHTIVVEAPSEGEALAKAKALYFDEEFFPGEPPASWKRHFHDCEIVETAEVLP
jgi:hypothetical protein